MDYITVPVMAAFHFLKNERVYVNFGPYAGMVVSAKFANKLQYETSRDDIKNEMKQFDYGLSYALGAKFKIPAGNSKHLEMFIECQGQAGLVNV